MQKNLADILANLEDHQVFGESDIQIKGIVDDSRKVKPGYLFIAIKGAHKDAHEFIEEVIKQGAVAIVGQLPPKASWTVGATYIQVKNSRRALGFVASSWFDNPSFSMKVIGVTGTDGKTTTSNLIYAMLTAGGKKAGLISTINAQVGSESFDTGFHVTNPEPLLLHELLAKMKNEKCEYVVLEVTSHGIDQDRVAGIPFYAGVLTNITREHLDYHKTFENYRDTKAKLFESVTLAVLNADEEVYEVLRTKVNPQAKVITYSLSSSSNYQAQDIQITKEKMVFNISHDGRTDNLKTNLLGDYNAANILAAVALSREFGVSWDAITKALSSFKVLSGRLEKISNAKGIDLYVDFAHTPNSLEKVLKLLRSQTKGNLIVVFGCASERDENKRPAMARIATDIADISVFTAEDPRSEDIDRIFTQMETGVKNKKAKYYKIPERGEAIYNAINVYARRGDTVVITGKGHERSMAYFGVEYPWSDQEAVDLALKGKVKQILWKKSKK